MRLSPSNIFEIDFRPREYMQEMAGYAIALPVRIAMFVKELLHLIYFAIGNLYAGQFSNRLLKIRLLCFFGATGKCFSGVVGIIFPPIAHKLDEMIQENKIIRKHAFLRKQKKPVNIPEKNAIRAKSQFFNPFAQSLQDAVKRMAKHIDQKILSKGTLPIVKQITLVGLLLSFQKGERTIISPFEAYLCKYCPINLSFYIDAFQLRWGWLIIDQKISPDELVETLIIRASRTIIEVEEKHESCDKIEPLYQILSKICTEILDKDKVLFLLIKKRIKLIIRDPGFSWRYLGSEMSSV